MVLGDPGRRGRGPAPDRGPPRRCRRWPRPRTRGAGSGCWPWRPTSPASKPTSPRRPRWPPRARRSAAETGDGAARADALLWLANARFRLEALGIAGRPAAGRAGGPGPPGRGRCSRRASPGGGSWGRRGAWPRRWSSSAWSPAMSGDLRRRPAPLRGGPGAAAGAGGRARHRPDPRLPGQPRPARQGDYVTALACAEESLATARALGDRRRVATALGILASVAQALGDARAGAPAPGGAARGGAAGRLGPVRRRWRRTGWPRWRSAGGEADRLPGSSTCWPAPVRAGRHQRGYVPLPRRPGGGRARPRPAGAGGAAAGRRRGRRGRGRAASRACASWRPGARPVRADGGHRPPRRSPAHPHAATWLEVGRLLPLEQVVEEAVASSATARNGDDEAGAPPPGPARRRRPAAAADPLTHARAGGGGAGRPGRHQPADRRAAW